MIELDVDRHGARLRVGRWHFRTWRSFVMKLPSGYRTPLLACAVEYEDEDGTTVQIAAFFDETVAEACKLRLKAAGRYPELHLRYLVIHSRLKDWQWNR